MCFLPDFLYCSDCNIAKNDNFPSCFDCYMTNNDNFRSCFDCQIAQKWRYRDGIEPRRIMNAFFGRNFGTIEIQWNGNEAILSLAIRTEEGQVARKVVF